MTNSKKIILHPYQQKMLKDIVGDFAATVGRRVTIREGKLRYPRQMGRALMVQLPTGTGKTVLMAACIKELRTRKFNNGLKPLYADERQKRLEEVDSYNIEKIKKFATKELLRKAWAKEDAEEKDDGHKSVWVIAHRRELVEQIRDTLTAMGLTHVDGDGTMDRRTGLPLKVMSVQWLARHYDEMPDQPALLVIDEAHHSLAPTYKRLWERYPMAMKLGFTATPCRMTDESFQKLYDNLYEGEEIKWFIKNGYLSEFDYVTCHKRSFSQRKLYNIKKFATDGDFAIGELEREFNVEDSIDDLYQKVVRYAPNKKGIVYAIDIVHAKNIARYYQQKGIRAVALDNKTAAGKRKASIEQFKQGELDCIVNVDLFSEGFDCPDVDYVQLARPTLSLAKYLQMVGRGLRVHPAKERCIIIDNVGLWNIFGAPDRHRDWVSKFNGWTTGKFELEKYEYGSYPLNNDMVTMRDLTDEGPTEQEIAERKEQLKKEVAPFEQNGRWGLRNSERIYLAAMFRTIRPSDNGCFFCQTGLYNWEVRRWDGKLIFHPEYSIQDIEFLPLHVKRPNKIGIRITKMNNVVVEEWVDTNKLIYIW